MARGQPGLGNRFSHPNWPRRRGFLPVLTQTGLPNASGQGLATSQPSLSLPWRVGWASLDAIPLAVAQSTRENRFPPAGRPAGPPLEWCASTEEAAVLEDLAAFGQAMNDWRRAASDGRQPSPDARRATPDAGRRTTDSPPTDHGGRVPPRRVDRGQVPTPNTSRGAAMARGQPGLGNWFSHPNWPRRRGFLPVLTQTGLPNASGQGLATSQPSLSLPWRVGWASLDAIPLAVAQSTRENRFPPA